MKSSQPQSDSEDKSSKGKCTTFIRSCTTFIRSCLAALVATSLLLPGMLALVTVVVYLIKFKSANGGIDTLWCSLIIVVVAWVLFAFFYHLLGFTKAENSIPSSFGELQCRLTQLKTVFKVKTRRKPQMIKGTLRTRRSKSKHASIPTA